MDPTACLTEILSNLDGCHGPDDEESSEAKARNREEAIEGLRNLATWLEKGGFPPSVAIALEAL